MGQLILFIIMIAAIPKVFGLASAVMGNIYNSLLGIINGIFTPKNSKNNNPD